MGSLTGGWGLRGEATKGREVEEWWQGAAVLPVNYQQQVGKIEPDTASCRMQIREGQIWGSKLGDAEAD